MDYITNKDTVAILLLNWNGHDDTIECLDSIKKLNYPYYKIYLVDNNSRKESVEAITQYLKNQDHYKYDTISVNMLNDYTEDENKNLFFILNDRNAGFAGGNNVGLNYFIKKQPTDYILLLNNDTIISQDLLDALIDKMKEDNQYGFIGSTHYFYDDRNKIQTTGGGKIDFTHGECAAITQKNGIEYDFITGSCIFLRTQLLKHIGPLPEEYFMYWEDVDWSTRVKRQGYKLAVTDYGCIYHKEGASIKSLSRIYYHTRNRICYMKKYSTKRQYAKFMIYIILYVLKEATTNIIKNRKYSKALIKGLIDSNKIKKT